MAISGAGKLYGLSAFLLVGYGAGLKPHCSDRGAVIAAVVCWVLFVLLQMDGENDRSLFGNLHSRSPRGLRGR